MKIKKLNEGIDVNTIADYITDHYKFETIDDKYSCIDSIRDSFKDNKTISEEELEQFIGSHNGKDKVNESKYQDISNVDLDNELVKDLVVRAFDYNQAQWLVDNDIEYAKHLAYDNVPEEEIAKAEKYLASKGYAHQVAENLEESMKDYRFEVSCNDGPTKVVKLIWDEKDVEGAKEMAKKYYAQEHTTYADDRHNKWIIEESLEENVQYGVHQFSTDSIIFRGTEEECGEYIDNNKDLWDDAEVYRMNPNDPHYKKDLDEASFGGYNYKFGVHWVSPDGNDKLLGGSESLEDATKIAIKQLDKIANSSFEETERKIHFIDNLYIVDTETEQDVTTAEVEEHQEKLIKNLSDAKTEDLSEASYGGAFDIADDQIFTREDIDNLAEEVLNHINETYDYKFDISAAYIDGNELEVGVENDELGEYITTLKIDMRKVKEPWHLKRVYAFEVASDLINQISRSLNDLGESLTESATEGAKPIETGAAIGMAAVLSDLIKDEYEAIEGYNSAIATAEAEGYGDMVKVLTDIQAEENIHIGQLQELMKMVDPNAHKIEDGYAEAAEELLNPIDDDIINDDAFVLVTEDVEYDDDIADEDVDAAIKAVEEAMKEPNKEEIDLTASNFDLEDDDEVIVESTEPWEDIYKSFKDIEFQLNGDGEAITATIDRIYQDNKDNPDFEKAYQKWASNE